MNKEVILTGLRANNDLHIGNYFGALLPIVDMAKKHADRYQINLFIPDLHSFTTPVDHSELQNGIRTNARVYAAAGLPLDNDSIHLYRQSYVPAHSELTLILNSFTGMGEMGRMTQYKDKSQKLARENTAIYNEKFAGKLFDYHEMKKLQSETFRNADQRISVGLFDYPVLMASDILLYGAKYVPVGDDQTQHLEFTRDIAERMNKKFGEVFVIPEPVAKQHEFFGKDQGLRIKDLLDPNKKMSKSDETGAGVIFLSDAPEAARKKIMRATTDDQANVAYDPQNQPGISNLLDILALLRGQSIQDVAKEFAGQSQYGEFKKVVADEVAQFLTDFQNRLASVDNTTLEQKMRFSEAVMNEQANATLHRVQKAVGLR